MMKAKIGQNFQKDCFFNNNDGCQTRGLSQKPTLMSANYIRTVVFGLSSEHFRTLGVCPSKAALFSDW